MSKGIFHGVMPARFLKKNLEEGRTQGWDQQLFDPPLSFKATLGSQRSTISAE